MCLNIKSGPHIAQQDFYTVKYVENITKNTCDSYYRGFRFHYNKLYKSWLDDDYETIEQGLHSILINSNKVSTWLKEPFDLDYNLTTYAIVLCKIPKGAIYYLGKQQDVASNQIKIIEPLVFNSKVSQEIIEHYGFEDIGSTQCAGRLLPMIRQIVDSYGLNVNPS